jgi:hypothetical protein
VTLRSCVLASDKAKLGRVWLHMLRHSCGYYLADKGTDLRTMQDYLGHRHPKHTAHYTRVARTSVRGAMAIGQSIYVTSIEYAWAGWLFLNQSRILSPFQQITPL